MVPAGWLAASYSWRRRLTTYYRCSSVTVPLKQWTFVAATWDTLMLRVFVGPAMFAFVVDGTASTAPSTSMSVGCCAGCGCNATQFYGYIAEVGSDVGRCM